MSSMTSTSGNTANTKAGGNKKPKRPLSGYNLFYRYKRIKVLEATSHPTNANGKSDEDLIREVVAALPGLEGVSPRSPIFASSPAHVDEFRATAIRAAMEGKLFPNENGRQRLHRKVHGVGFVEMGRMMRQLWGQADKFTKGVFCELAEVGRTRYKKLAAEFRLEREKQKGEAIEAAGEAGIPKEGPTQTPDAKSGTAGPANSAVAPSHVCELDPRTAAKTPPISNTSRNFPVAPAPLAKQHAAADGTVPMTMEEAAKLASDPTLEDPSATAESADSRPGQGYRRRVSTELDAAAAARAKTSATSTPADVTRVAQAGYKRMVSTEDFFSPDAKGAETDDVPRAETPTGSVATVKTGNGRGRRGKTLRLPQADEEGASSREPCPVVHAAGNSGASFDPPDEKSRKRSAGSHSPKDKVRRRSSPKKADLATQRKLLRKAIQKLKDEIIQNNKSLPPKMQVGPRKYRTPSKSDSIPSEISATNKDTRKEVSKEVPRSGGTPSKNQQPRIVLPELENTQDFVKMIGTLGAAIDESS